ncbi:hypothetical protein JHK87_053715 [Glycine soja]|nr:hypothetical protein JHK87_053715 [Glycine soja]
MEKFLCELLLDSSQPISERFRAFFSLRNLKGASTRNALILATRDSSNLLAHEAAFALGHMQELEAIPALASVLNDLSLHHIVRHEAAEALGAIGSDGNVPLLKNSLDSDPAEEVRETCELALERIQNLKDAGNTDVLLRLMYLLLCLLIQLHQRPLVLLLINQGLSGSYYKKEPLLLAE